MLSTGYKPLKGVKMKSQFPFFAELNNKERTLIRVVGAKVEHNDNEYQINGRTIKRPGNIVQIFAYEILGTGEVKWEANLKFNEVHRDIVEKYFPKYVI